MLTNMGLHIIKNPAGSYSYAGSIPVSLGIQDVATKADVMAGRAWKDKYGVMVAVKFPTFASAEDAAEHARKHGGKLCSSPSCACRNLFS